MTHHTISDPGGKTPSPGEMTTADLRCALHAAITTMDSGQPLGTVQLLHLARLCLAMIGGGEIKPHRTGDRYMTSSRFIPATAGSPCKICKAVKRCSETSDGCKIICYKESKDCLQAKVDCQGVAYWIHRGPNYTEPATAEPLPIPTDEIADVETRHQVYSALLAACRLSPEHRAALRARGMINDADINARQYGTLPGKPWRIAERLRKYDGIVQVPGFVLKDGKSPGEKYLSIAAPAGLLIPCRNAGGKIVALKIRPDKDTGGGKYRYLSSAKYGGPKANMTTHVPLRAKSDKPHVGPIKEMRITEGELKADVATVRDAISTLSVPGVGNWGSAVDVLRSYSAETVRLAFDNDIETNADVARHFLRCHAGMTEAGFHVLVERWPAESGKGIDDLLAGGGKPEVLNGDATEYLEKLKIVAASKPKAETKPDTDQPITVREAVDDPHRLGRLFVDSQFRDKYGVLTLRFYQGDFHRYIRGAWRLASMTELKAGLTAAVKSEFDRINILAQQNEEREGNQIPRAKKVTRALIENTILAIQSLVFLSDSLIQPCWLTDDHAGYPPGELLVTQSGILHLPSIGTGRECLLQLTPNLFTPTALDYAYDAQADCPEWLKFLNILWPSDSESISLLQEYMGLLLTSDTQFHKLLMIIGPTRSGKGTIGRTIRAMLGEINVASPKLGALAEQFGLACLVGKTLALVADCRLSGRADAVGIVESILSITGEDPQDIQRKFLPTLAAIRLLARFVILANELPRLQDAAGALMSRVLLLKTTESFLGREDRGLEKRLLDELPGILNWAIEGWQRLMARGQFEQPESANQLLNDLAELSSPTGVFLKERCIIDPAGQTAIHDMYAAWQKWCEQNGREHPGNAQTFGRDIRTALPQLTIKRDQVWGVRTRLYVGIRLRTDYDPDPEEPEEDDPRTPSDPPSVDSPAVPDADRPRNVRLGQPKLPPWVQRTEEGVAS